MESEGSSKFPNKEVSFREKDLLLAAIQEKIMEFSGTQDSRIADLVNELSRLQSELTTCRDLARQSAIGVKADQIIRDLGSAE